MTSEHKLWVAAAAAILLVLIVRLRAAAASPTSTAATPTALYPPVGTFPPNGGVSWVPQIALPPSSTTGPGHFNR